MSDDSPGDAGSPFEDPPESDDLTPVYATRGLIDALLELARDAEPREVTAPLAVTPAADLDFDGRDALDPEVPVFTDFYLPNVGDSIASVFGMDLGVPAGQTQGRFISHPQGELAVSESDHFHARMVVAVPPWEPESVAAFDRRGRKLPLVVVDAEVPERPL